MSKQPSSGANELSAITDEVAAQMLKTRPRERPMPAPTQLFQMSYEHKRVVAELEKLKREGPGTRKVPLTLLSPSPLNSGPLIEARIQALTENLRENPLTSPILLRASVEGRFEILAGRHRAEAFRRLGRSDIDALVAHFDDDAAERVVFFDNLFAPSLSDYEKYLGFAQRKKSKGYSLEQLAVESGVSKSQVGRLMSFERLPAGSHPLLLQNPDAVSAYLAEELCKIPVTRSGRVLETIGMVVAGQLVATRALKFALNEPPPAALPPNKVIIRRGRQNYAEIVRRERQLTVKLTNVADMAEVETAIRKTLAELARE